MLHDPLANALSQILNNQRGGKRECVVRPISTIITQVIEILHAKGYLGSWKTVLSLKGSTMALNLLGTINNCGAIKPRYSVKRDGFEKFEKRYLPAKDFGVLIVSTPKGLMTHQEAKEKGLGGSLIAYCY